MSTKKLWAQRWIEFERGWGWRPDGYSVAATKEAVSEHANEFRRSMRAQEEKEGYGFGHAPDCYSETDGEPFETEVSDEIFKTVTEKGPQLVTFLK